MFSPKAMLATPNLCKHNKTFQFQILERHQEESYHMVKSILSLKTCFTRQYTKSLPRNFKFHKVEQELHSISLQRSHFSTHLFEIKRRIQYAFFSIVCSFATCYIKSFQLLYIFLLSFVPFKTSEKFFIFTDMQEAFSITITVCFFSTLIVCLPLLCYQTCCFLLPSCYCYEAQNRQKGVVAILLFWYLCISFFHLYVIPQLCFFFLQFQIDTPSLIIKLEARILSYVSWITQLLFFFTLFFMLILVVLWGINKNSPKPESWIKKRKYLIWGSFLSAAIVSPPEFAFQISLALLIFVFIEILYFICFFSKSLNKIQTKFRI